jgi:Tol biopolymer transport system component
VRDTARHATMLVSVSSQGRQGNGPSFPDAISPDGRFVLFESWASNLSVAPDTNRAGDVFIRDLRRGTTRRVSIPPGGGEFSHTDTSYGGSMSADGRFVLFGVHLPSFKHVFLRDRLRGTTIRIARRFRRAYPGAISPNGRMLAYFAASGALFIHDRATGRTTQVRTHLIPNRGRPVVFTPDGREAVFSAFDPASAIGQVVLWKADGTVIQLPHGTGASATSITDDGTAVAFTSSDDTLVPGDTNASNDLFREDVSSGTIDRLDLGNPATQLFSGIDSFYACGLSGDGRWAAFTTLDSLLPADTNGGQDVYLRGPLS